MQEETERQLIERAKAYDEQALDKLYRRHADDIYRYIYYRVGDSSTAEDLVGDVFINMLEGLASYEYTGAPFESWLYRIAHARVVDHYRRQEVRQTTELDEGLAGDERVNPDTLAGSRDRFRRAWDAMQRLTNDQQHVLALRFFAGYSVAETAEVLGKTEGAVKSLQYRALVSIRRLLGVET